MEKEVPEERGNKSVPQKGTLIRLRGDGTTDPFTARMCFGILDIRSHVYKDPKEVKSFDSFYKPILQNLKEARHVKEKFKSVMQSHSNDVDSGNGVTFEQGFVKVDDEIDFDLNIYYKDFFIRGCIAIDCLAELTAKFFGVNVEFLFGRDKKFKTGTKEFLHKHPEPIFENLLDMLKRDRNSWLPSFTDMRRQIEHRGFELPHVKYEFDGDKVVVHFPLMNSIEIPIVLERIWESLFSFCEDVIVMLFASKLKFEDGFSIQHIPEDQRDKNNQIKYRVAMLPPPELLKKFDIR